MRFSEEEKKRLVSEIIDLILEKKISLNNYCDIPTTWTRENEFNRIYPYVIELLEKIENKKVIKILKDKEGRQYFESS